MSKPIPTIDDCLQIIEQYEMLDNIREHSFMVARVAKTLTRGLSQHPNATAPDLQEVLAGALLHDIAKTRCLQNNSHHARDGQSICEELGYPEIGEIVLEHVVLREFNDSLYKVGHFGAKEIVYYSDKRVRHDQVVTLDDRLAYILERYGDGDPIKESRIRENFSATIKFEQYLFSYLLFPSDQLLNYLSNDFR